jgi:predicted nuclease with TOPRIM domain
MEQHYMEILFEEMRGKFDLVLEAHAALNTKIDDFRRESNEKHELTAFKLQVVADQVKSLDGRVGRLEGRVGSLEGRFDKLESKVDAIAADLAAHRADTEAHPRYLVRE